MSTIILTGVTGQDGSHMADYLLKHTEHKIYGGVRRLSVPNHKNIEHINSSRFELINLDLNDSHSIEKNIATIYVKHNIGEKLIRTKFMFVR